jgi:hypothetical protein
MIFNAFTEPAGDLLSVARAAGFEISEAQLARWHRIGLLPKPRQQPLGRRKGSRTVYPPGSTDQLLALCRLHQRERSLTAVGWALWRNGFPVSERYWRSQFREAAVLWDQTRATLDRLLYPNHSTAPSQKALRRLMKLAGISSNPIFARIRKRVRTRKGLPKAKMPDNAVAENYLAHADEDFQFFVLTILDVFLGRFKEWPGSEKKRDLSSEGKVIDRALGIHVARSNQIPGIGAMLTESVAPIFTSRSSAFSTSMLEFLDHASDTDLAATRDEIFALLEMFGSLAPLLEWAFGKWAFGFGSARQFLQVKPQSQALFILLWHVARNNFIDREQVAVILGLQPLVAAAAAGFAALPEFLLMNPEYETLLTPRRVRGAIRNPERMTSLKSELLALKGAEGGKDV